MEHFSSNVEACIHFFLNPLAFFSFFPHQKFGVLKVLHCYNFHRVGHLACCTHVYTWSLCGIGENSMILGSYHELVIFHHHYIYCGCLFSRCCSIACCLFCSFFLLYYVHSSCIALFQLHFAWLQSAYKDFFLFFFLL